MSNNIAKGRVEFLQGGIMDAVKKLRDNNSSDEFIYDIFSKVREDSMMEEAIDMLLEQTSKLK